MLELMKTYHDEATSASISKRLLERIKKAAELYQVKNNRLPAIMEVCGSHTMALARTGIKSELRESVRLISGPGCPVCVTEQKSIDAMLELANIPQVMICTFGDMLRVPGSKQSLMEAKAKGKEIRVVLSPLAAVDLAKNNPEKQVVFLGIGFETTIPVLVAAIKKAEQEQVKNFSIWFATKLIEPILRRLLEAKEVAIDGYLLPGHVSIVIGKASYQYLIDSYSTPGVISGFTAVEMLSSIYILIEMLLKDKPAIVNNYRSVVTDKGNLFALELMNQYLIKKDEAWRGIGMIAKSGLDLKEQYQRFDAKKKFNITIGEPRKTKCRCGEIIRGLIEPEECPLFSKACTPVHPVGPCMVSSEGTCAAHYSYLRE